MSLLVLTLVFACSSGTLRQAGHELQLEHTKTWSMANGTRYGVDLVLDGEPLAFQHWYHPLSPPPSMVPRTVYFGDGWSEENWAYDTWMSFQIVPSNATQHTAIKAFMDAGTDTLFDQLADSKAYKWSYPRHQFVLFETEPGDQLFVAPSGDRFSVTPAGAVYFGAGRIRARIGALEVGERGTVGGISLRLEPHTVGSGPGAVEVRPSVADPMAYRHTATGQDVFAFYGVASPEQVVQPQD